MPLHECLLTHLMDIFKYLSIKRTSNKDVSKLVYCFHVTTDGPLGRNHDHVSLFLSDCQIFQLDE